MLHTRLGSSSSHAPSTIHNYFFCILHIIFLTCTSRFQTSGKLLSKNMQSILMESMSIIAFTTYGEKIKKSSCSFLLSSKNNYSKSTGIPSVQGGGEAAHMSSVPVNVIIKCWIHSGCWLGRDTSQCSFNQLTLSTTKIYK